MNEEKTEDQYRLGFEIITFAGNSKSLSIMAIESSRKGDFEEAEKLLMEANENMVHAHEIQTKMIRDEITGNNVDINMLVIHAQDHLTMATMARENAQEFFELYKTIYQIKQNQNVQ